MCFSHVWLFATPWMVAHDSPLSMGFFRQEYWSGLPCPPPEDLPNPGIEPASLTSPALAGMFFTTNTTWKAPLLVCYKTPHHPTTLFPILLHWSSFFKAFSLLSANVIMGPFTHLFIQRIQTSSCYVPGPVLGLGLVIASLSPQEFWVMWKTHVGRSTYLSVPLLVVLDRKSGRNPEPHRQLLTPALSPCPESSFILPKWPSADAQANSQRPHPPTPGPQQGRHWQKCWAFLHKTGEFLHLQKPNQPTLREPWASYYDPCFRHVMT